MRNTIAAVVASAALLAGGALVGAPSASAATPQASDWWDHIWTTSDSHHGGTVYIRENDDIVDLCDTYADGYAPRLDVAWEVAINTRQHYNLTASGGYGSCVSVNANTGYNIPESTIWVTISLGPDYKYSTSHSYLNDH